MMKLTLDGRELKTGAYDGRTLSQVIDGVEKDLAPERVIVAMSLNGEPLDRAEEKRSGAVPVDELVSLEIRSQKVNSLALDTLHTLIEYFPQLEGNTYRCIETLQGNDESEGHRRLGVLIDGLQMVSSAWHGISRFLEFDDRKPTDVMPDMSEFNLLLNDILNAQQNNDVVQICDLLEFELIPIIQNWADYAAGLVNASAASN